MDRKPKSVFRENNSAVDHRWSRLFDRWWTSRSSGKTTVCIRQPSLSIVRNNGFCQQKMSPTLKCMYVCLFVFFFFSYIRHSRGRLTLLTYKPIFAVWTMIIPIWTSRATDGSAAFEPARNRANGVKGETNDLVVLSHLSKIGKFLRSKLLLLVALISLLKCTQV